MKQTRNTKRAKRKEEIQLRTADNGSARGAEGVRGDQLVIDRVIVIILGRIFSVSLKEICVSENR